MRETAHAGPATVDRARDGHHDARVLARRSRWSADLASFYDLCRRVVRSQSDEHRALRAGRAVARAHVDALGAPLPATTNPAAFSKSSRSAAPPSRPLDGVRHRQSWRSTSPWCATEMEIRASAGSPPRPSARAPPQHSARARWPCSRTASTSSSRDAGGSEMVAGASKSLARKEGVCGAACRRHGSTWASPPRPLPAGDRPHRARRGGRRPVAPPRLQMLAGAAARRPSRASGLHRRPAIAGAVGRSWASPGGGARRKGPATVDRRHRVRCRLRAAPRRRALARPARRTHRRASARPARSASRARALKHRRI